MRKNAKRITKRILSFILSLSLILSFYQSLYAYTNGMGMGSLVFNERREIAPGVFLDTWLGETPSGTPKRGYSMTFDPKTSDALVVSSYGDSIGSRKTLTKMISAAEDEGYMVIGGINGDFFNLDTGVPIGPVIKDGRLVCNNGAPTNTIGFNEDGSVIIGTPKFEIKAILDNSEFMALNFNKAQGIWGPYIYTSDFGATTRSTVPSIEITVDISMGSSELGNMMVGTVSNVNTNAKSTPIGKNQIVLSAQIGQYGEPELRKINVGDPIGFTFSDPEGKWNQVRQAVGGGKILISQGVINSAISTSDVNPYTAIGVKANGEVVFFEVDGRNSANSVGVSSMDAAKFLQDLGCTDAIAMDGGGSSTISARMPGDVSPTVLNKPSDGSQRLDSNGLLLISKQSARINSGEANITLDLKLLHVYPGKTYILPGSNLDFRVTATNEYFFPVSLPQTIGWAATGGQLQNNGHYTSPDVPGTYQITASSGQASGSATVVVIPPEQITTVKSYPSSVSILPGASQTLNISAEMDNLKVPFSNNSLIKWQVDGNVGTITQDGVFTASGSDGAQGAIKATIGNATATIPVTLAKMPDVLEDFENTGSWASTGIRTASQSVGVVEDPTMAAFGNKMLKLDYDMTLMPGVEKGTSGVYAFPQNTDGTSAGIVVDKTPTAIGMWVYGDNGKTWLRMGVKDGSGQSFDINFTTDYSVDKGTGGINWTGWKYVEASIPSGKQGPFTLDLPVRLMCSRDEMRTKGTIYIDQIRAIYGAKSDDTAAPTATITSPADQTTLTTGKTTFEAEISDNVGIENNSVKLYVDGALTNGIRLSESDGVMQVEADLGSTVPMADGLHVAELRFMDKFGNKGLQSVSFTVQTGAPQVMVTSDSKASVNGTFNYTLNVKNPNTLKKLYIILGYDKNSVEVVDADSKTAGTQISLEGWVKKGKIINSKVDAENGRILLEIDNLNAATKENQIKAATITFKTKSAGSAITEIALKTGAMIVGKNKGGSCFSLPVAKVDLVFSLVLTAEGFSKGEQTLIRVTDKSGNPVEGAEIHYSGATDSVIAKTDKAGKAQTSTLTNAVGNVVPLSAVKSGITSNTFRFTISEPATGLIPQALNMSFDDTNTVLKFNYVTDASQTGTIMQVAEKSSFTGTFASSALTFTGADSDKITMNTDQPLMVRAHSVDVQGLKPGTSYVYRFKDASGRVSAAYEFSWPDTSKPYSFVFLTDPQGVNEAEYSLYNSALHRAYALADNPAFAVIGGDMVDRGNDLSQWNMFFSSSSSIFSKLPFMAVPGNHEKYDDETLLNYRTYLGLPENGAAGLTESSYSFETNDALFMVMNTQESIQPQLDWMQKKVQASTRKWKIVLMHRGLYSGFYDESDLRKLIAPAFDKMSIDLVLNGHDHTYLRTTMKAGVKTSPGNGTTYITGGSSANKYYDAAQRSWTEVLYDTNKPVFTVFKVLPDRISVTSSHIYNGETIEHDRFDIVKK